jgi:hypothetical protein
MRKRVGSDVSLGAHGDVLAPPLQVTYQTIEDQVRLDS